MKVMGMRVGMALLVVLGLVGVGAPRAVAAPARTHVDLARPSNDDPERGETVTLRATVHRSLTARPTGTVTFLLDGATTLGTAKLRSQATPQDTVVLATRAIPSGAHEVTAVYSGDTRYAAATSGPRRVDVYRGHTTTALRSAELEVPTGTTARFIAKVSAVAPASGKPTGTVRFTAGSRTVTVPVDAKGIAMWKPRLPDGAHQVTARFEANDHWYASASPTVAQRVGSIPVPEVDLSVTTRAAQPLTISSPGTFLATAQVFVAGRTGTLTAVEVEGGCIGGPGGPGSGPSLPLWIKAMDGGNPTGAILATGGEPSGDDDTTGLLRFDLATPVAVTQGTSYAIVLAPSSGSLACEIGLAAEGQSLVLSGSVWSAMGHTSLRFRTWVRRP